MLEPTNQTTCFDGALLLRELSHRLNNEFTSAISVISLTAARSGSHEVKAALSDVSDRLHRYADVHRTLQMPEYQAYIDAALYLQQLCLSISRSRLEPNNIKLVLAVRPLSIPSDRCWRLGMIVYELITNSARHAFRGQKARFWFNCTPREILSNVGCLMMEGVLHRSNVDAAQLLFMNWRSISMEGLSRALE